ncbi:MAG: hypothetical protein ABSB78_14730 [Bacteroidota bacterium]
MSTLEDHCKTTKMLALKLKPKDVFIWLSTKGYFPENYVLPPCYQVVTFPKYNTRFTQKTKSTFKPKVSHLIDTHFPKSVYTDKTFSIINPCIHNDIALDIAQNWKAIIKTIFNVNNRVYPCSFPIPLTKNEIGKVGKLRSGRMIYEYINIVENGVAAEAYKYSHMIKADIKNCYGSIYTHSIS